MCSTNKKTIYLGGNIVALKGKEAIARFKHAKKSLEKLGYKVLSPTRGKTLTSKDDADADNYAYEPNEIVHRDLNDIRQADMVIAREEEPSIGTAMEICYAREVCHIPVIVISSNPVVQKHYWIRYFASKVVPDIESAVKYIKKWRWY